MSKGLRTLYQAVQLFRDLDPTLPSQTVVAFLLIAAGAATAPEEDIQMRDLQAAMDTSSASVSRNVAVLTIQHRLGKPGLNLVERYEDPRDRRNTRVRLTPKGRALRERLAILMR